MSTRRLGTEPGGPVVRSADPTGAALRRTAAPPGRPCPVDRRPTFITELHRTLGNTHVQRMIQRYAVPAALPCDQVVDWLHANSPYAPEWAATRSTFSFRGRARLTVDAEPDGTFTARIRGHPGLRVAVRSPVDRPRWSPSRRPNRAAEVRAWAAMRAALDAHEADHVRIAERERARVEAEYRALDISAAGATRAEARAAAVAQLEAQQQQWTADAQTAQDAIDPFGEAVLDCPAPADAPP
jgi:hypothetical protein